MHVNIRLKYSARTIGARTIGLRGRALRLLEGVIPVMARGDLQGYDKMQINRRKNRTG
jgi:hypothetical protein